MKKIIIISILGLVVVVGLTLVIAIKDLDSRLLKAQVNIEIQTVEIQKNQDDLSEYKREMDWIIIDLWESLPDRNQCEFYKKQAATDKFFWGAILSDEFYEICKQFK